MQSRHKSSKNSVVVAVDKGYLRLQLPREISRQYFNKPQKYIPLGLKDTPINRKVAGSKAQKMEADIAVGNFDASLARYELLRTQLTVVEAIKQRPAIRLMELWDAYFKDKRHGMKAKTIEKYENFTALFRKLDNSDLTDSLKIKNQLLSITTSDRTRDALMYLSAACKWGIQHGLIGANPFQGMAQQMPRPRYLTDPKPNAFTEEERDQIITAFRTDRRKGMNYSSYANFVEFLFGTGCRPSEAIGLRWKHISDDCGMIQFEESLVQVGNKRVQSKGSKNNTTRTIAVSPKIQNLLKSIRPDNPNSQSLVFTSPRGDSINYRNFARRAWSHVVDPIKPDTTPYCCQDTFITTQLLKGVPSAVIAKWCDTSTQMIDKNYADKLKLSQLRPED